MVEKRELLAIDAEVRKKAADEYDHKLKYFKLHKWDLLREHREIEEEDAR